ncbi:MAG: hypothetical protein A2044_05375 [Candidatus Firestonebacteria bacterium GWA2_43_8]|nr:MAG: hypothetical protein A2044_05375 [Candidatus Firestonebacteria bacterium GWA2_43_8]
MSKILSTFLVLLLAAGAGFAADDKKAAGDKAKANEEMITSLEEDGDIDSFDIDAGVEATIEAKHSTVGKSSMKIVIPENSGDKWPGIGAFDQKFTSLFPEDWTPYSEIWIDVFNESETPIKMFWKFKSDGHTKQFGKDVSIPKGKPYTIKMKMKDIKNVNLASMMYMKLFVGNMPVPTIIYIDNIRLIKKEAAAK